MLGFVLELSAADRTPIHRQLSAPTRKPSPILFEELFHFPNNVICRISIEETQTCLEALSLLSACNTLHSAHISSNYEKKLRISIPQILPTSKCGVRSESQKAQRVFYGQLIWDEAMKGRMAKQNVLGQST